MKDKELKAAELGDVGVGALVGLIQAVTGLGVSDKKDVLRDVSHLVQRGIQGHLATGFAEEYQFLRERGRIKEDYQTTDQCRQEMSYVFDTISSDSAIDEKRFKAIKNIFLNAAQEQMSDRNSLLPIELMRICSTLNTGEILVIEAAYRLNREVAATSNKALRYQSNIAKSWLDLIADESGLGVADMVAQYEQTLIDKGLLNKRTPGNQIITDTNYHLSGMGLKLCEFIMDYDIDDSEVATVG